jgi:hypothetical protein
MHATPNPNPTGRDGTVHSQPLPARIPETGRDGTDLSIQIPDRSNPVRKTGRDGTAPLHTGGLWTEPFRTASRSPKAMLSPRSAARWPSPCGPPSAMLAPARSAASSRPSLASACGRCPRVSSNCGSSPAATPRHHVHRTPCWPWCGTSRPSCSSTVAPARRRSPRSGTHASTAPRSGPRSTYPRPTSTRPRPVPSRSPRGWSCAGPTPRPPRWLSMPRPPAFSTARSSGG